MAEPISIQQLKDASEDAITLADFIYKPANVMIPRRLAADINSLQYYLDYMSSYAQHSYETYDEMVANAVNLPSGVSAFVTNDLDATKNGMYTYNGASFVKGDYQPEKAAKDYVEAKLGGLQVFDGKVRAQDVSTADGSTQESKNTEFRSELDGLPPFVDGGLEDVTVITSSDIPNTISRSLHDINSNITYAKFFGIKGDGVTEDSDLFNLALLTLSNLAKSDGKPRALVLDPNSTYMVKQLLLQPMVDVICLAGTATLKRVDVPVGTAEDVAKWWRIAMPDISRWTTDLDYSHRVKIHNINFDGNMYNAQWTFNTYNQEQASCLMLLGRKDGITDLSKRAKFDVRGLHFKDSVSDGLHIVANADVTGNSCTSEKCFRGGLVITGGNSVVNIDGWTSDDARLDIEIDSGGINESFTSFITVHNYQQDVDGSANNVFAGGADIGAVGNGGLLDLDNVKVFSPPFNWQMGRNANDEPKSYSVRNSIFHVTNDAAINPAKCLFKDVEFVLRNDITTAAGIKINPSFSGYKQDILTDTVWDNVTISLYSDLPAHVPTDSPVTIEAQDSTNKWRLKIINSDLSDVVGDIWMFGLKRGGHIYLDEVSVNTAGLISGAGALDTGTIQYAVNITLGKIHFGALTTILMLPEFNEDSTIPNFIEYLPNFTVPQRANKFVASGAQLGVPKTLVGTRKITNNLPPNTDMFAYKGDRYAIDKITIGKPYEWLSIKDNIAHELGAEWVASKWVTGSFATEGLPVLTTFDKGAQNIDTTLNKLVTWTGTAWI